eukprot:470514-Rhodomonas_salina.1
MGSGKGPVANATKKHELARWDARIPSFSAPWQRLHATTHFILQSVVHPERRTSPICETLFARHTRQQRQSSSSKIK